MTCPFKVGDRVFEVQDLGGYAAFKWDDSMELVQTDRWDHLVDAGKPRATVTALTARGFTYAYDTPVQHGRPFWGTQTEGEVYEEGFHMWRKVD